MVEEKVKRQIILGAGSAVNENGMEGFLLGNEMLNFIQSFQNDEIDKIFSEFLSVPNYDEWNYIKNSIQNFSDILKRSNFSSLDEFIARQNKKEIRDIGYSLIISILASFQPDYSVSIRWYGKLLPLFFPPITDSDDAKLGNIKEKLKDIRIITFNYDLSLEKFLLFNLRNYFNKEEFVQRAFIAIREKIFHVYGQIFEKNSELEKIYLNNEYLYHLRDESGDIILEARLSEGEKQESQAKWKRISLLKSKDKLKDVNFCSMIIRNAARCYRYFTKIGKFPINIIEDERSAAKCELIKCDYLYILGFAFDPLNINRIGLNCKNIWQQQCFITNFKDNKKIERVAVNYLTCHEPIKADNRFLRLKFPIISYNTIEEALDQDFSLIEEVESSEGVIIQLPAEGKSNELPPFYSEYKKYNK